MAQDIALSAGIRSNLFSLQQTNKLLDRTNTRLASGRKVNTPLDNPTSYFAAENLRDRASGLDRRLDSIGQAIQTIKVADNGIKAIRKLLSNMQSKIDDALTESFSSKRADLGEQFNELIVQIDKLAYDTSYQGVNLIQFDDDVATPQPQTLTIQFSENYNQSTLSVEGFDISGAADTDANGNAVEDDGTTITALEVVVGADTLTVQSAVFSAADETASAGDALDWTAVDYKDKLAALAEQIETIDTQLQVQSKALNTDLTIVFIREEFTKTQMNHFEGGADKLTLADLNEESANLLSLQTSQQLGIQSLSLAAQSTQAVLRILG